MADCDDGEDSVLVQFEPNLRQNAPALRTTARALRLSHLRLRRVSQTAQLVDVQEPLAKVELAAALAGDNHAVLGAVVDLLPGAEHSDSLPAGDLHHHVLVVRVVQGQDGIIIHVEQQRGEFPLLLGERKLADVSILSLSAFLRNFYFFTLKTLD